MRISDRIQNMFDDTYCSLQGYDTRFWSGGWVQTLLVRTYHSLIRGKKHRGQTGQWEPQVQEWDTSICPFLSLQSLPELWMSTPIFCNSFLFPPLPHNLPTSQLRLRQYIAQKTLVSTYYTATQCHNPKHNHVNIHCHENSKCYKRGWQFQAHQVYKYIISLHNH